MKFGMRTPSLSRSIKARTTGKLKRSVKKAVNPLYGKPGMGLVSDPIRSVSYKIYKKTTFSILDLFKKK
jgi:hypothetical protein